MNDDTKRKGDLNLEQITGGPELHTIGTAVGAGGGAVTGAVIGTALGGPVGALVGGAIGAATGAVAGHATAKIINPAVEDAYWSANFKMRHYVEPNRPYADYQPAYRYGWEARERFAKRTYHDIESDLERGWERARGQSKLSWMQAKHAVNDAWLRFEDAAPIDPSRCCH